MAPKHHAQKQSFEFVSYDAAEGPQPSPGFLFVDCNGRNGTSAKASRSLHKRHAILRHFAKSTGSRSKSSGENPTDDVERSREDGRAVVSTTAGADDATQSAILAMRLRRNDLRNHSAKYAAKTLDESLRIKVADPIDAMNPPFQGFGDLNTLVRWYFYRNNDTGSKQFAVAKSFWLDKHWDWARQHELEFGGIALYAYVKRITIGGATPKHCNEYYRMRTAAVRKVRDEIDVHGPLINTHVFFLIVVLAYCALHEGDKQTAATHLGALEVVKAHERVDVRSWAGATVLDFRYALLRGERPILGYFVPEVYRNKHAHLETLPEAIKSATKCSALLPSSTDCDFGPQQSYGLLWTMFKLSLAWPDLTNDSVPPFEYLYDAEYKIRSVHANILKLNDPEKYRNVELVILAIQLHLWIVCRFWIPVRYSAFDRILSRGHHLLVSSSCSALVDDWTKAVQCPPSSLLWVISTITACSISCGNQSVPFPLLSLLVDRLGILDESAFLSQLKEWPWLDSWHGERFSDLWKDLAVFRASHLNVKTPEDDPSLSMGPQRKATRESLFLGALEFNAI